MTTLQNRFLNVGIICLFYGFFAIFLGFYGGFPYPCDHDVRATVISCLPADTIGDYTYTFEYTDFKGNMYEGFNC